MATFLLKIMRSSGLEHCFTSAVYVILLMVHASAESEKLLDSVKCNSGNVEPISLVSTKSRAISETYEPNYSRKSFAESFYISPRGSKWKHYSSGKYDRECFIDCCELRNRQIEILLLTSLAFGDLHLISRNNASSAGTTAMTGTPGLPGPPGRPGPIGPPRDLAPKGGEKD